MSWLIPLHFHSCFDSFQRFVENRRSAFRRFPRLSFGQGFFDAPVRHKPDDRRQKVDFLI
jgi:hypothetical protein